MALPAIIAGVATKAGAKALLAKAGSFLFGSKLRTGLTALTAGVMLGGNSSASNSQAARQSAQYRA